jgi:hypothetical protein
LLWAKNISRPERVTEARQIDGIVGKLYADQLTSVRELYLVIGAPIVVRQVPRAFGRIGASFQRLVRSSDRKREARTERVRGAHKIAKVESLRHALCADGKIAAWYRGLTLVRTARLLDVTSGRHRRE